jgi:glycosyltransferase involved in cell wall biosynthesis
MKIYTTKHFAFIIPTRNRPDKVRNLLQSFVCQMTCGRIIIVDSGDSIISVIEEYKDILPLEYYCSPIAGQIAQRNYGISLLDDRTPLVGCLDDDIVLMPSALEAMCSFWNNAPFETAGVGFNIINQGEISVGLLRRFTMQTSCVKGKVLRSGTSSDYHGTSVDLRISWLCGGASMWQLGILKNFPHEPINVRWAIGEDLIFSYPIGKLFPLYACAAAQVRHEHVNSSVVRTAYYHGLIQTLMRCNLVAMNDSLSFGLFTYSVLTAALGKILLGTMLIRPSWLQFACGQIRGLSGGLWAVVMRRNLPAYIAAIDAKFR